MIFEAIQNVLKPDVLIVIVLSAAYGILIGSIPGLTATMAVALLVPLTFFMSDVTAIAAIVTLVACSIFAGDIPTTLVRIPGTPSSAAYTNDAYALRQQGRHGWSLQVALICSVFGGLLGAAVLIGAAPVLARVVREFTSVEQFWLVVLGLSCAAIVSQGSLSRGGVSLLLGLLFSTVGLSAVHSTPRFSFGRDELINGINFIPAMIGLFGLSEVLRNAMASSAKVLAPKTQARPDKLPDSLRQVFRRTPQLVRSSGIGVVIGMLPGAGADIAAWVSYAISKRFSRNPKAYGSGSIEGIADATGANNAALAGAWIPALVFGIPGDSVTAIVIGVLLMKNITPGAQIFEDPKQATLLYSIYATFIVANLILIPIGLIAIRVGGVLVRVPKSLLFAAIVVVCVVGSYAMNGSYFDVLVMVAMGVLGLFLESFRIPLGPMVLGIILGSRLEHTFIQTWSKTESVIGFFDRPISGILATSCLLLWLAPWIGRALRLRNRGAVKELTGNPVSDGRSSAEKPTGE